MLLLLLDAVESDFKEPVLDALGAQGTELALPVLISMAGAFFSRGGPKRAAAAARDAIVKRNEGVAAGGLTIVEDGRVGGLSSSFVDEDER